jgi:glyoxalase family protein
MNHENNIRGIHHITAIASSAAENLQFYETLLGLRLVKQTVNFDDPHTYHLYFGDAQGSPGTILTFFPWEQVPPGSQGAGMVTAVNFTIPAASIDYWTNRFSANGIACNIIERFGDPVIAFSDPDGLPLELTGISSVNSDHHWRDSPVEAAHAIPGFHSATATVPSIETVKALLTDQMGMHLQDHSGNRYRFKMAGSEVGSYYDIVENPSAPTGRQGSGTVHHIAFRTGSQSAQLDWQSRLNTAGFDVSPVRDRNYFRSIYFRSPDGVLFEIATDPPGFTVDESTEALGRSLKLPSQYERMRSEIERHLPPLRPAGYRHVDTPAHLVSDAGPIF